MQSPDTERIREGWNTWTVFCLQCDKQFESKRSDATFCSAHCRVRYHREAQQFQDQIDRLGSQGKQLINLARNKKRSKKLFEAMKALKADVDFALAQFEE